MRIVQVKKSTKQLNSCAPPVTTCDWVPSISKVGRQATRFHVVGRFEALTLDLGAVRKRGPYRCDKFAHDWQTWRCSVGQIAE